MQNTSTYPVVILGAGPAGLILANHLCASGVQVLCLSSMVPLRWPNNYGLWLDDVPDTFKPMIAHQWDQPAVRWKPDAPWTYLDRPYVLLDNARMIDHLQHTPGLTIEQGWVLSVDEEGDGFVVKTRSTERQFNEYRAQVVIDATGYRSKFVEYTNNMEPGYQTALGVSLSRQDLPTQPDMAKGMILMDYAHTTTRGPATFLYAMDFGDEIFLEETVLVGRPALKSRPLGCRMKHRLGFDPWEDTTPLEQEWCWIPMGSSLPDLNQNMLAFGGAASMVHPATGYQMAQVFNWAETFARSIARGINDGLDKQARARLAWDSLWTRERLRQRALYCYGMEALLSFDVKQTQTFFEDFFNLSNPMWAQYLSWNLSSKALASLMLELFGSTSTAMKFNLMRPAMGSGVKNLLRAAGAKL